MKSEESRSRSNRGSITLDPPRVLRLSFVLKKPSNIR